MTLSTQTQIGQLLQKYQTAVEEKISSAIPRLGPPGVLREACAYALTSGGKRFRPALVLMIADAVGRGGDASDAALAIEFFHTASLIADDLPCMDNDDERRNKPSLHRAFGETTALLTSYALIAAGYQCLADNTATLRASPLGQTVDAGIACQLALENASYNTGLNGAAGGQQMDLFPAETTLERVKEVIQKKTISLFEVSFVFGWLFGGGDPNKLEMVKKAAFHLGLAFQVADDIEDIEQDASHGYALNMAILLGKEAAESLVDKELSTYFHTLKELRLLTPQLQALGTAVRR